ncbi:MAG: hypothetical protein ABH952_03955 [Candidatus Omnitrophota bacterium]
MSNNPPQNRGWHKREVKFLPQMTQIVSLRKKIKDSPRINTD